MKIGITGGAGQFGFHLRCRLTHVAGHEVAIAGRDIFADSVKLGAFVKDCDAIVHLAGVNRGADSEVRDGNLAPARDLAAAISDNGVSPLIVYASSIQRDLSNVYGDAKADAADILAAIGSPFCEIVLPNLFGEYTRPNYNSFVATFCHQIAAGDRPGIHGDNPVELMHYSEAAEIFADALESRSSGQLRPSGRETSVAAVAGKIAAMHADYRDGIVPDLRDSFDLDLFNTYRSVLFPAAYPFALERRADQRGSLFECVKERNGGQCFFSTTLPGITRGNHFHFHKVERFVVLAGTARISIRRLFSDVTVDFDVNGKEPVFVDMPTLHTHNITNTGDGELLTLFWSHDIFDPDNPDTYAETV
ncbi:MAG: SDR family oxidoreductase [Rhodobiaceae bacterium]|nr:NAD-dependent epimerase/dehydratase family protein [Rhodobiaceae bacterium]MCC0055201.1 SDR family oxidoreductase [Rhodobiaceae bacterium]